MEKIKKLLSVFEDLIIEEKDGKLIISEKVQNLPELINFVKIYEPEKNIKQLDNIVEVETSVMSANKFKVLLMSVFNEYDFEVVDAYKLKIFPKKTNENLEESKEVEEKETKEKFVAEKVAKFIDKKFNEEIELYNDKVVINTKNVDEIAKILDEKFEAKVEIYNNKIIVKGE